jgi:cytidine deaminase
MLSDSSPGADLLAAARAARDNAYAPYSGFKVGAAVRAAGEIFTGANVENAAYGDTLCAERVAVASAVAAGHTDLEEMAIVTDTPEPPVPCGSCLQFIAEFAPRLPLWLSNRTATRRATLDQLLPQPFSLPPE